MSSSDQRWLDHAVVATGHMIDDSDRQPARFPDEDRLVALVATELAATLDALERPIDVGIAAAASGADIVFHEVCLARDIDTEVHLACPRDEFVDRSVLPAGAAWLDRFDAIVATSPVAVVETDSHSEQSIWQQANEALLKRACAVAEHVSLIAVWDEATVGHPGGTADMVAAAEALGVKLLVIDLAALRTKVGIE